MTTDRFSLIIAKCKDRRAHAVACDERSETAAHISGQCVTIIGTQRFNMPKRFSKIWLTAAFTTLIVLVPASYSQTVSVESMKALLGSKAGFTPEDYKNVDSGEISVKRIPVNDKREIAVCGLIRLDLPFDVVLEGYRRTINKQKRSTVKDFGRFSAPPSSDDLNGLEFDEGDIESLRECRVGDCKWHLPAEMINRLRSEIDWDNPKHNAQASALLKNMLIASVAEYLAQGDASLMEYNDKEVALGLKDEYQKLEPALFWSDEFAPGFREYYEGFPAGSLPGIENTVTWAKIKVGLKEVVFFTHNTNFKKKSGGVSQAVIVAKQIYANHYFDSTLGVTVLVGFPKSEGKKDETYLIFVNHTRARALGGSIGKLIQGLVKGQAVDRVEDVLADTRKNSQLVLANRAQPDTAPQEGIVATFAKRPLFVWVFVILVVAGIVLLFMKWRARHS